MVDHDSMGPSLQLVVAWISFPESCHVNSNFADVNIVGMAIFPYCLRQYMILK